MQFLRMRRWMIGGAMTLSLAIGAVGAVAMTELDQAFAQEDHTELDGVVEQMPTTGLIGTWQVSGKTIQVTDATAIDQEMGQLAVGVAVEVEGAAQPDGSIVATEIEVEDNR